MSAPTYRMLAAGEVIHHGDQCKADTREGGWFAVNATIGAIVETLEVGSFRRPIPAPSPGHTPWRVLPGQRREGHDWITFIEKPGEVIGILMPSGGSADERKETPAHIVSCVNSHDALAAEVAALSALLKSAIELMEWRGEPPIEQGSLCEEQGWRAVIREARALLAKPAGEARP